MAWFETSGSARKRLGRYRVLQARTCGCTGRLVATMAAAQSRASPFLAGLSGLGRRDLPRLGSGRCTGSGLDHRRGCGDARVPSRLVRHMEKGKRSTTSIRRGSSGLFECANPGVQSRWPGRSMPRRFRAGRALSPISSPSGRGLCRRRSSRADRRQSGSAPGRGCRFRRESRPHASGLGRLRCRISRPEPAAAPGRS